MRSFGRDGRHQLLSTHPPICDLISEMAKLTKSKVIGLRVCNKSIIAQKSLPRKVFAIWRKACSRDKGKYELVASCTELYSPLARIECHTHQSIYAIFKNGFSKHLPAIRRTNSVTPTQHSYRLGHPESAYRRLPEVSRIVVFFLIKILEPFSACWCGTATAADCSCSKWLPD